MNIFKKRSVRILAVITIALGVSYLVRKNRGDNVENVIND